MGSYLWFLSVYIIGGVTFLPSVLALVLIYAYLTLTHQPPRPPTNSLDSFSHDNDDIKSITSDNNSPVEKYQRGHESDVAEGYFAVCREYVPGGQNGKPPERTTPAGEVVVGESPSVYQSMYRSIFERKQVPTLDTSRSNGKASKKAANVFYITLRHGHLILFDDSDQLEVRHVISLNHHDVSIYGGGNEIPEGELWIKRNAICLTRKPNIGDVTSTSKPFYLFSENCSEKEDFYFALLQNRERGVEECMPTPQQYAVEDIISLVKRLHSSEEQLQTRWINALVGRLFLAMYKTQEIEDYIRLKITKKIARVKKPTFLSGIILQKIDLGEAAPYVTNPRLKDLTVDGNCCVEADFRYNGNFRLEIAATARIDLGTRFKAREVNLVLAVVIKKFEGHVLVRLKPPPSNRVWISFEKMPNIEMAIEPIISSRQITYGIILRAIESRIREVVAETLVLPHWDDSPFTNTVHQRFRGGIWTDDQLHSPKPPATAIPDEELEDEAETDGSHPQALTPSQSSKDDRSMSMPTLADTLTPRTALRKTNKSTHTLVDKADVGVTSGVQKRPEPPRAIRSQSFASVADPILSMDNANVDSMKNDNKNKQQKDAASSMIEISHRSQPASPIMTPLGSPNSRPATSSDKGHVGSYSSTSSSANSSPEEFPANDVVEAVDALEGVASPVPPSPTSVSSKSTIGLIQSPSVLQSMTRSLTPTEKRQSFPTLGATAAAAKKWGWGVLSRNPEQKSSGSLKVVTEKEGTPEHPIGRGRPLPPVGQPLPPPDRRRSTPIAIPKRKPLPPPMLPDRPTNDAQVRPVPPPPLPNRRKKDHSLTADISNSRILVVEAPPEPKPASPLLENEEEFVYQMKVDLNDEDLVPSAGQGIDDPPIKEDQSALPRPTSDHASGSYEDNEKGLPSWQGAIEEEKRSKSIWSDDDEHP